MRRGTLLSRVDRPRCCARRGPARQDRRASVIGQVPGFGNRRVRGAFTVADAWRERWRPASVRVFNRARLHAEDLRAGGRRARRKYDVELFVETLDSLEDQYDLLADLEAKQMVDVLVAQLDVLGLDRVKEMVPWMLRNAEGQNSPASSARNAIRSPRGFIAGCGKLRTRRASRGTETLPMGL